jgi:hypothetical protein
VPGRPGSSGSLRRDCFDASALVKLVVDEDGSGLAVDLWDGCDAKAVFGVVTD